VADASTTDTVPSARARVGPRARGLVRAIVSYAITLGVAATIVVPLVYTVIGGLRTTGELRADPIGLPADWYPATYLEILQDDRFWDELANSLVIALAATFLTVALSALAAFVFARLAFRGRELLFTLFVLGLLFPSAVAILPLYILVRQLHLLDNPLGVILPQAAFGLPLSIVILRPFFRSIPRELEDAARIDGCGTFGFFWRVLLPLSRPALATVSVLAVVASWNQFLLPLLVLGDADQWTLPLGVMNFSTQYSRDIGAILAYSTLAMIPALLFYIVAERQLVRGLTSGAVKG
jgi:raffinose/stachyose/melibiose transport system permease protein